jgi:16S rRNA (uracil1498-N3)-methyltransferase
MQYLFNDEAGSEALKLKGEAYKYLFKVRRHNVDDVLYFRQREENEVLFKYKVLTLDGRSARLELLSKETKTVKASKYLHIAWCIIDPKSVEKVLPSLNELGVSKITFIFCARSQKNYKIDLKRYERILETSSQQCGRSDNIVFNTAKNIESFIKENPQTVVLDFCDEVLGSDTDVNTVLLGCEGGFSDEERVLFKECKRFRLDTPMILRSESAAMAIASKVLL